MYLSDTYQITAGDVAQLYAGRFWDAESNRWYTVSGINPPAGGLPKKERYVRAIDVRVVNSVGGIKSGVRVLLMTVLDPLHTEMVAVLNDGVQGSEVVSWFGQFPVRYGLQWRVHSGAVVAGDIVSIGVDYE